MKGLLIAGLFVAVLSVTRDHAPPALVTRPSVDNGAPTGTGVTLTATAGTYTNAPTSYTREWRRNGVAIGGATGLTYVTASGDKGKYLSFYEKAVNASGDSGFIRAETGNARQLWFNGDSLMASPDMTTAIQSALDAQYGAGKFELINLAISGTNYDTENQFFESVAQQSIDINMDTGWGLTMSFDYANQFLGLQGLDNGATGLPKIYTFGTTRTGAGAAGHIYCTSPYPTGSYGGGHDGTNATFASNDIVANYLSHNGVALVDFRDSTLTASILANDNIHWTSDVYPTVAAHVVAGMVSAGLVTTCGGIYVPISDGTNLKTYNDGYYFDPVTRLPWPHVHSTITTTSANSWNATTVSVIEGIKWFNTGFTDGWQTLYFSSSWQTSPKSGGITR